MGCLVKFTGCASPCQILWRLVEPLRRYCDLTVFKLAAVHRLRFLKFKILTATRVKGIILRHRAKFRGNCSNHC